jgi:hypothetical protein
MIPELQTDKLKKARKESIVVGLWMFRNSFRVGTVGTGERP